MSGGELLALAGASALVAWIFIPKWIYFETFGFFSLVFLSGILTLGVCMKTAHVFGVYCNFDFDCES